MSDLIPLTDSEFKSISSLVYKNFGINLTEQKKLLIRGRLQKILRQHQFTTFSQYYDYLAKDMNGAALVTLVNRISTNHTFFYRENEHFKFIINTVLPEMTDKLQKEGRKDLRIWCAGCSSGEEPYTLAMLLLEYFKLNMKSWDVGLLATDISEDVIKTAMAGVYTDENVSHLPKHLATKYFDRMDGDKWGVKDQVKKMILFRRLNLMREKFPFRKKFDVILCRNVMIYFDSPTKKALVNRFFENTQAGGYLFIGHSESIKGADCPFMYQKPAVYKKEL